MHESGNLYCWEMLSRIDEMPLAEPPAWLVQRILNAPFSLREGNHNRESGSFRRVDLARLADGIPDGERDVELFRFACSLRQQGYSRSFAEEMVLDAARRCRPPFPDRVARLKVKSAWRYA